MHAAALSAPFRSATTTAAPARASARAKALPIPLAPPVTSATFPDRSFKRKSDCLIGALTQMRQHRMGGIAQKRESAVGPGRERPAVIEAPPEAGFDVLEQVGHEGIPALERGREFVAVAGRGPGLRCFGLGRNKA